MQNKAKTYAQVLVESLNGASEEEVVKRVKNFKKVLYKHGRAKQISDILQEFKKAWEEKDGPLARVVSARALPESVKREMEGKLSHGRYVMKEEVDERVIGGVALFLGNQYLIDGTVRGKLKNLESVIGKEF